MRSDERREEGKEERRGKKRGGKEREGKARRGVKESGNERNGKEELSKEGGGRVKRTSRREEGNTKHQNTNRLFVSSASTHVNHACLATPREKKILVHSGPWLRGKAVVEFSLDFKVSAFHYVNEDAGGHGRKQWRGAPSSWLARVPPWAASCLGQPARRPRLIKDKHDFLGLGCAARPGPIQ